MDLEDEFNNLLDADVSRTNSIFFYSIYYFVSHLLHFVFSLFSHSNIIAHHTHCPSLTLLALLAQLPQALGLPEAPNTKLPTAAGSQETAATASPPRKTPVKPEQPALVPA
jgi:hypothetical protein